MWSRFALLISLFALIQPALGEEYFTYAHDGLQVTAPHFVGPASDVSIYRNLHVKSESAVAVLALPGEKRNVELSGISGVSFSSKPDYGGKVNPEILKMLSENQSQVLSLSSPVAVRIYLVPDAYNGKSFSEMQSLVSAELAALGIDIMDNTSNPIVAGIHSVQQLKDLLSLSYVSYVDLNEPMNIPLTLSEGVDVINAPTVWNYSYTGSGVRVGVLDVGFENWEQLVSIGELPQNTLLYTPNGAGSGVHGSACAEIVYDVAPGIEGMYLANTGVTIHDLYNATKWMIDNGVRVISHSVGWFGWGPSMFDSNGDGIPEFWDVYGVVDYALSRGVVWVNAAGNEGDSHWEGFWRDADGDGYLDIYGTAVNSSDIELDVEGIQVVLENGSDFLVWARWSDYGYPNNPPTNDFDMYLFCNVNGSWALVESSERPQNGTFGQEPAEFIEYYPNSTMYCMIVIGEYSAPNRDSMYLDISWSGSYEIWNGSDPTYDPVVEWGSIASPADHPEVIAVGAVPWYDPWWVESFSSRGPAFNPYIGVYNLTKPDVVAPDGVVTLSSAPFYGTSAAAPHVTGMVALMLSRNSTMTPLQVKEAVEQSATDAGVLGRDNTFGAGIANAPAAVFYDSPEAMLRYFRMYDTITSSDAILSGNHTFEVWNLIGVYNINDPTDEPLSGVVVEASADSIYELWWRSIAILNSTYVRWDIPYDIYEDDGVFVGFQSGVAGGRLNLSIWRDVNRTVFQSDGYQLVNVTLRYDDTNFMWGTLTIDPWYSDIASAEFVNGTFSTDAPLSYYEFSPDHIHVEFNRSQLQPGQNYTFSVLVYVHNFARHPVEYVPQIRVGYGVNITRFQDGKGLSAEVPASLLPSDIHFVRASASSENIWTIQRGELYSAVLDGRVQLVGDIARLEYYEERITFAENDSFSSGSYPVVLQNKFKVYNYPDSGGKAIDGFNLTVYTDRPIKYVWWSSRATWGGNEAYWDFSDVAIQDGGSECCMMAAVDGGVAEIPVGITRTLNITEADGVTFQQVNVTFRFTNLFGERYDMYIHVWDTDSVNATILAGTFETDFPFDWIGVWDNHIEIGAPGYLVDNRTYHASVVVMYNTTSRTLVKPEVAARITLGDSTAYYGLGSTVNVSFENVSAVLMTNSDFDWDVRHIKQVTASLKGIIAPAGEVANLLLRKLSVFEIDSMGVLTPGVGYRVDILNTPDATSDYLSLLIDLNTADRITKVWRSITASDIQGLTVNSVSVNASIYDGYYFQTTVFTNDTPEYGQICAVERSVSGVPQYEANYTANVTVVCNATAIAEFDHAVISVSIPSPSEWYYNTSYIISWDSNASIAPSFERKYYIEFPLNVSDLVRPVAINLTYHVGLDMTSVNVPFVTAPQIGIYLENATGSYSLESDSIISFWNGTSMQIYADRNVSWNVEERNELWIIYDGYVVIPGDVSPPYLNLSYMEFDSTTVRARLEMLDEHPEVVQALVSQNNVVSMFAYLYTNVNGTYWLNFTPAIYEICSDACEQVTAFVDLETGNSFVLGFLISDNYSGYAVAAFDQNGSFIGIYQNPKLTLEINVTSGEFYPWLLLGERYGDRGAAVLNGHDITFIHLNSIPITGNFTVQFSSRDARFAYTEGSLYTLTAYRTEFDVDGDGNVTIADVTQVAWMLFGKVTGTESADFNKNGRVDIGDLARIVYYLMEKL